ncbi:MAG: hypothetical protein KJZ47_14580 [Gemmatimonadales bacterium]|nr:hypothetical protein [Gemmatimonadales bacterium]
MKPTLAVATTGVVAVLLWKVLLGLLLPLLGIAAGFLILAVKVVFLAVMIGIAIWLFRRAALREERVG